MDIYNLVSFCGVFIFMFLGCFFSANRRILNVRCIVWGLVIQMSLALLVFRTPAELSCKKVDSDSN